MNARAAASLRSSVSFGRGLRLLVGLLLALPLLGTGLAPDRTAERMPHRTSERAVALATVAVEALHARLGGAFTPLVRQARAVLIAPGGAQDSLLLLRGRAGWSEPAFFVADAPGTSSPAILLVMSDRGMDAVLRQRGLQLDGPGRLSQAALAPGQRTGGAGADGGAELLLWAADGHPRLDDAGPIQDDAANAAWYGYPRSAAQIVGDTPPSPRTATLRAALAR